MLALTQDKGECGRLLKDAGLNRKALEDAIKAVRGGENVPSQEAEGQREALKKYEFEGHAAQRALPNHQHHHAPHGLERPVWVLSAPGDLRASRGAQRS